ncbi:MAG: hypothetical protein GF353_02250 [Candidatus Lokiarchaeota archaeon]|nr:hypothetical protein [Candidatus Lokiarchaeota archaeon]
MGLLKKIFKITQPLEKSENTTFPQDVVYATWICLGDSLSCELCKSLEGMRWIPSLVDIPSPPHPGCKNSDGCRCMITYISSDGEGIDDIYDFIKNNGGKVTGQQFDKFEDMRVSSINESREHEHNVSNILSKARNLEKDNPEKSISLYRAGINLKKEINKHSKNKEYWEDFGCVYSRLTLVLEKLGKYKDALSEIIAYEKLPKKYKGSNSEIETIEKRKLRITKKMG